MSGQVWTFTAGSTSPEGVAISVSMTLDADTPDVRENGELVQMAASGLYSRYEQSQESARKHAERLEAEREAERADQVPF